MQSIYFLLSFFAVAIVIRWCMVADRKPGGEFEGLLALKKDSQPQPQTAQARHGRFLPRR